MKIINFIISLTILLSLPSFAHVDGCEEQRVEVSSDDHSCCHKEEESTDQKEHSTCDMPCCHLALVIPEYFAPKSISRLYFIKDNQIPSSQKIQRFVKEHFRPPILS